MGILPSSLVETTIHPSRSFKIHLQPQKNHMQMYIYFQLRGTPCADGRNFTESKNHWMVWVGRGLEGNFILTPYHGQGILPLEQVVPRPVQPEKWPILSTGYRETRLEGTWMSNSISLTFLLFFFFFHGLNLPGNTPEENNPKMETPSLSRDHGQFSLNSTKTCCIIIKSWIHRQEREFMVPETHQEPQKTFSLHSSIMKLLKARPPNKGSVLTCSNQAHELDYLPSDWILEVYIIMTAINWKQNYGKCLNDRESHMWKGEQ